MTGVPDYARQSSILLDAAERFERNINDARLRDDATKELLEASEPAGFGHVRLGFQNEPGTAPEQSLTGRLSAVLFDLQSGNVLVAAGLRTEDEDAGRLLHEARSEVATTREDLQSSEALGFAAQLNLQSATAASAAEQFRNYSGQLLAEMVDQAGETVKSALGELRKLDPVQIGNALGELGDAVPIVAAGAQLVRRGLEKLKRAIEALTDMFGSDAVKRLKDKLKAIMQEAGSSSRKLLEALIGSDTVKKRIEEILGGQLTIAKVDGATNALAPLAQDFARNNKLLRAVLRTIRLAGVLLALVPVATPWLAPSLAIGYLLVIATSLLLAQQYAGALRVLTWIDGVEQIANRIEA